MGMAVALRTLVDLLDVLERGEFVEHGNVEQAQGNDSKGKSRSVGAKEEVSESRARSAAIVGSVRSEAEKRAEAMKLLKAASFALDVLLPGPVELVWKLFVRGGHRLADGMDEAARTGCKCLVV